MDVPFPKRIIMNSNTGSTFKLMQLFVGTRKANNADMDGFTREDVLSDLYVKSNLVSVKDNVTLVHMSDGSRVLLERRDKLINVTYLPSYTLDVVEFWMNASSLETLGNKLRMLPRGDFDTMLIN